MCSGAQASRTLETVCQHRDSSVFQTVPQEAPDIPMRLYWTPDVLCLRPKLRVNLSGGE